MRLVLLSLALVAGCSAARPDAAAPADTPATGPSALPTSGPVVTLDRTVCYGTCPAYTVSATADGRVTFDGREHVARVGAAEWRVAPSVVAGLVAAAERAGHAGFPASLSGPEACPLEATDNPTATTTVRTASGTKRVAHDGGCEGFAGKEALTAFEDEIDRALGTAAYVGPR